jgi:glutathione S-transferase
VTTYRLVYWPSIPGRGEFPRLLLEDAGVPYVDVAREEPDGVKAILSTLRTPGADAPLAPPILEIDGVRFAQSALLCHLLGQLLDRVPAGAESRALQLQLTVADLVDEVHDTHHPIASGLRYEDQRDEAARRAEDFRSRRLPKFLGYLEGLSGDRDTILPEGFSYVDLSLFHLLAGLRFAFPEAMASLADRTPGLDRIAAAVRARPRVAAYLASPRRVPFSDGIFRHYPELDGAVSP